jgi:hypothetical protein
MADGVMIGYYLLSEWDDNAASAAGQKSGPGGQGRIRKHSLRWPASFI